MLWRRYRLTPSTLTPDWYNAFQFVETIFGDPFTESPRNPSGPAADELARYLRRFGHLHADLDPLGIASVPALPAVMAMSGGGDDGLTTLYRGSLGVETGHLDSSEMEAWVQARFETSRRTSSGPDLDIYQHLLETELFDQFLATKYPGKKRFGSEGADAILPLLHHIRNLAGLNGIDELVIGSMHRGRLSILANFLGADLTTLLGRIAGAHPFPGATELPGDVPYHLGCEIVQDGVRCTLLPNPSHLEAVNPVVVGYARARRTIGSGRAMAVVIHTDASVVGQGVNAELLQMSALAGFEVGGALHIVINNQVGFTTEPSEARSSRYCTGGWRAVDSLIVHANGDDVDGVIDAGTLAFDFRARFARDAVIDLVCYRANGHNEIDEPRFTQPRYYQVADIKQGVVARYEERLLKEGRLTAAAAAARRQAVRTRLETAFGSAAEDDPPGAATNERAKARGLPLDALQTMIGRLSEVPAGRGHPKMVGLMQRRRKELETGISWALAETMAFASALGDGISIRFCGQDIERGPFSQRHLAAIDPDTGERWPMLQGFARDGATLEIVNSPLSEYAVLGFEYGYALAASGTLCIWEAQFGDFANGAQIMIDQFIASDFEKWRQTSKLAVLLPHGLEGQGPEHSSARIERLLQLCARDNIVVAHPSTPANYFHLLRDHATAGDRSLFVMTPKMLLRLPRARSAIEDFGPGSGFVPVIVSSVGSGSHAILCSGKIAYEAELEREKHGITTTILRLETLYPLPADAIADALREAGVRTLVWLQEEPENYGAGAWLMPRLGRIAAALGIGLEPMVARPESASPAGSFHGNHDHDQHVLVLRALGVTGDGE